MADETTTTSANDFYLSAYVVPRVLLEARPHNVCEPFLRYQGPQKSNAADFPIQDDPGAAAPFTEGTGGTNTQLTSSKATATVGTVGQMATVTDELVAVSIPSALDHFAGVLGRSVAEKFETDCTALLDDFSNTTGTSGSDLTIAQWIEAMSQLETRDQTGQRVAVLHPQQVFDLRAALVASTGAYFGNDSAMIGGFDAAALNGYQGTFLGVPVYETSLVNSANGGADRAGAMIIAGEAIGHYEVWGLRTETQRDASMPGTEVVSTRRYGLVEIRDAAGESIITDA